jgi:hypothetical protein
MCFAVAFHLQTLSVHLDQDCSVFVRAQQFRAAVCVALHDLWFRMSKAVEITHGEYRVAWLYGGNEFVGGRGLAAVRLLEAHRELPAFSGVQCKRCNLPVVMSAQVNVLGYSGMWYENFCPGTRVIIFSTSKLKRWPCS